MPDCNDSTVFLPITDPRPHELHLHQLRGPRRQGVDRYLDAGREHAAEELTARRHDVEVGRRPEIDDDRRAAVQRVRRERVDDAVGTDFLRVVVEHRHAGTNAGLDDDQWHCSRTSARTSRASRATPTAPSNSKRCRRPRPPSSAARRTVGEQPRQQQPEFVRRPPRISRQPPVFDNAIAVEEPQHSLGVADINGEKHEDLPGADTRVAS